MGVRKKRRGELICFLYVLPALTIYVIFRFLPFLSNYVIAFFRWSGYGITTMSFVGLRNYANLLVDPIVKRAIVNNVFFLINEMVIIVGFALVVALCLNVEIKGSNAARTLFFVPIILPLVVVGIAFTLFLNPRWGIVNVFLRAIGLGSLAQPWLAEEKSALFALLSIRFWRAFGYYMILLVAGLGSIPKALYDAAKTDGANWWQILWYVTLPSLRRIMALVGVLALINGLRIFVIPFVMTGGGPFRSTEVISTWAYYVGFQLLRMGYASAILCILATIALVLSFIYLKVVRF